VDLGQYDTEAKQVEALRLALSKVQDGFLLVLDNANDEEDIWAFKQTFEGFHWHVLFTSRCDNIMPEQAYKIEHLPPPLAKALFIKYYQVPQNAEEDAKIDQLLRGINYHTLLVEIFAKNAAEAKGITPLDEFIEKLENYGLFLGEDSFVIDSAHTHQHLKKNRATTDEILNALYDFSPIEQAPELRKVLVNFAVLPAQDYTTEFIYLLLTNGEKEEKKKLQQTLKALNSKGWLSQTQGQYRMNPLIQELSRKKNQPTLATDSETLLTRLNALLANDGAVFLHLRLPQAEPLVRPIAHLTKCLVAYPSLALASCSFKAGLYYRSVGDPVAELQSYLNYQGPIQALRQANPNNLAYERELALSHSLLGDFYLRLGDAKKAEENYSEGLRIFRKLASLDEQNSRWQQDLATSLSKMGDFYLRLGDAKKAEENYSEGLRINRKLASLDEQNTSWQQDLATSLSKMGDFYLNQGEAQEALNHYIEAKTFHEALLGIDESSVQYLFDYALDFLRIGNVFRTVGMAQEAVPILQNAQQLLQQLVTQIPEEVNFKEHLELVNEWLKEINPT
jgi:tetratricopeptide (TPR) repeat protein